METGVKFVVIVEAFEKGTSGTPTSDRATLMETGNNAALKPPKRGKVEEEICDHLKEKRKQKGESLSRETC